MFRHLIMAIFRLYMKYLLSSYTKHVVAPYVQYTLYSTTKHSCVRRVHTFYVSYFIEHNEDDEPRDYFFCV